MIDVDCADVRGPVDGAAPSSAGHTVGMGVVDTGVGRHGDLTLAGGDRVKQIASMDTFCASFPNLGVTAALTAPGVAVISTIFGDRWGVMSETSMATRMDTGVPTRRLVADAAVLGMPHDSAHAAPVVQPFRDHAEDSGLPPRMQGAGLAR